MKMIKSKIITGFLLVAFLVPTFMSANNGQDLFKQNCAACHKIEGNLVGPGLKGIKAKWEEAGESENLIKWIQNPKELFISNTSEMAKLAWEIMPSEMTPQALSVEDINAILEYVDSDIAPEELIEKKEISTRVAGEPLNDKIILTPEEITKKNKERDNQNRIVFGLLMLTAFTLVLGIVSTSKTIQTFTTLIINKNRKETSKNKGSVASIILLLIMLIPFSGYSLSFDIEKDGWFFVSEVDNIVFLIFNLLLLLLYFEQNKTLKSVIAQYDEKLLKKKNKEGVEIKEESLTHILTGAVAIEDEATILMDHDFDGIRELDNNLPPWWVWGFVASIIFAFAYLIHYHVIKTGDLQDEEYNKSVVAAQIEIDAYMSDMAMDVDESNVTILIESADINSGKALFASNCVVCHKEKGEGLIGPNLTDKHWLIGDGTIGEVFKTIKYGTTNGMPEHESKMNPVELQQVASFVLQLEFTEGKAPEGKEVK